MEALMYFVRATYPFFLVYTLVYLLQWVIGTFVSLRRLSRFPENQQAIPRFFTDALASQYPVSVIVPAYNEQSCICDTIDSLLKEDYPGLEIIVVDDGSADSTASRVVRQYRLKKTDCDPSRPLETQPVLSCYSRALQGKNLTLICKKNGGKSDALNCGLNYCPTPYCVIVDADTQVRTGALRIMAAHFFMDKRTIVCAGAVGTLLHTNDLHKTLPFYRRLLVKFQHIEYYRTFYMQRLLFDHVNANVIVSGAFAMFDRDLVLHAGGYRTNTIGEDMELTMRLHAYCLSQNRPYRIIYAPEARCDTQVPFRYHDYFRQRRRWHIGMIQSLKHHLYMIGSHYYGWVGVLSVLFTMVYELLSPFVELFGLVILILSAWLGMLNPGFACGLMLLYVALSLLTQSILLSTLRTYQVEPMRNRRHFQLILTAASECIIFHPINIVIKLVTFLTYRQHKSTWTHILRVRENS